VGLTGFASVTAAVEAIQLGATHYLPKAAEADEILAAFGRNRGDAGGRVCSRSLSVEQMEWGGAHSESIIGGQRLDGSCSQYASPHAAAKTGQEAAPPLGVLTTAACSIPGGHRARA
jgi:DNA-binding NarL/FixJ family response regulator